VRRSIASISVCIALGCGEPEGPRALGPSRLAPDHLVVPDEDQRIPLSTVPLSYTHVIEEPTLGSVTSMKPHVAESREWAMTVSGAQLRAGLALPTTSLGALVELRRAPFGDMSGPRLERQALQLQSPGGVTLEGDEAAEMLLEGSELESVHPGLGGDGLVLRLDPALGSGVFALSLDGAPHEAIYGVRVRERDSEVVLHVHTDRPTYLHGESVGVHVSLSQGERPLSTSRIHALVRSPAGDAEMLKLEATAPGRYVAAHPMDTLSPTPGRLWTVQVSVGVDVEGGLETRRTATTSFAYALPTARLSGALAVDMARDGSIVATLPIEVAAEGRYAIAATLWGIEHDVDVPMLMMQSAAHLSPGEHDVQLFLDAEILARAELSPPFIVRDMRLLDQTRVALLQHHPEGFAIPSI
jgi:hypothetical protein